MARPKKDRDVPELQELAKAQAELDAAMAAADNLRDTRDSLVVKALEQHGFRTLAEVSGASIGAMQQAAARRGASSPRGDGHT